MSSSHELAPKHGARFVFLRQEQGETPSYRVEVHRVGLSPDVYSLSGVELAIHPTPADPRVGDAITKLARTLKRQPKARLIRWREL